MTVMTLWDLMALIERDDVRYLDLEQWNCTGLAFCSFSTLDSDLYDCLRYDVLHNPEFLSGIEKLYYESKCIADFVVSFVCSLSEFSMSLCSNFSNLSIQNRSVWTPCWFLILFRFQQNMESATMINIRLELWLQDLLSNVYCFCCVFWVLFLFEHWQSNSLSECFTSRSALWIRCLEPTNNVEQTELDWQSRHC